MAAALPEKAPRGPADFCQLDRESRATRSIRDSDSAILANHRRAGVPCPLALPGAPTRGTVQPIQSSPDRCRRRDFARLLRGGRARPRDAGPRRGDVARPAGPRGGGWTLVARRRPERDPGERRAPARVTRARADGLVRGTHVHRARAAWAARSVVEGGAAGCAGPVPRHVPEVASLPLGRRGAATRRRRRAGRAGCAGRGGQCG
jgi:hypothetical protein